MLFTFVMPVYGDTHHPPALISSDFPLLLILPLSLLSLVEHKEHQPGYYQPSPLFHVDQILPVAVLASVAM